MALSLVLLSACNSGSSDGLDANSDLVDDTADNCPLVYNPDQAASIGNDTSLGDACDDEDADGIVDAGDNCPVTANADQSDADGNGLGDACGNCEVFALAADIWSGPGNGNPEYFAVLEDRLFFRANDGIAGEELWMFSASEGASLAADVAPGSGGSLPDSLAAMNEKLYFGASNGIVGQTLWVYDPSNIETDAELISPADGESQLTTPSALMPVNGKLYFTANDHPASGSRQDLWLYDAAADAVGSRLLADFNYRVPRNFAVLDGKLYFTRQNDQFGTDLWVHDSAATDLPPAVLLPDIALNEIPGLLSFSGRLYTVGSDRQNQYGSELRAFDPSTPDAGFVLVADMVPGRDGSSPWSLTELDGKLYFTAGNDAYGRELWVYDPTLPESAPTLIEDIVPGSTGSDPSDLVALDGRLYFNLSTENRLQRLMVFDPANSSAGVSLAMDSDAYPDIDSIRPWATAFDGALYFLAGDSAHGNELWAYDPDCQAEGRHGLVRQ